MNIKKLTQENFEEFIRNTENTVLVDFWASWCGPCKMLAPVLEEAATEHPELAIGKVNVDDEGALAVMNNVSSIPTLMMFKDGKPIAVSVGFLQRNELEAFIADGKRKAEEI